MQSKRSFFNKTVFRKNLTRFAPVWVVYALLICTYLVMLYSNHIQGSEYGMRLGFVRTFIDGMTSSSMLVNLAYALLCAQLLFGDLYNSRMCNALHALPLRREEWFITNCLSGLAFSLIPTLVGTLVLLPMMAVSILEHAWILAPIWFLITNLQFIACFGLAAFAAMCVGSRFTMAAGYGLLHFGPWIAYGLVDTVYTPMLYGVITPTTLASNLTPAVHMINYDLVKLEGMIYEYELVENGISLADVAVKFSLTEHWWRIFAMTLAGAVFAGLALLLYRKRDLECAGDAVAFPILKPVFQVLCALFVMCAGEFMLSNILGMREFGIPIMAIGLVIGWFIAKMLLERTTRVFRIKNWYGLGILAACMALTLVATHFDILNIEERLPDLNKVEAVTFRTSRAGSQVVPQEQWEDVLRIHELAVADRVEEQGLYEILPDGSRVRVSNLNRYEETMPASVDVLAQDEKGLSVLLGYEEYVQAGNVSITYEMKNGSWMMRRYNIWSDGEIGDLTRKALSSWDILTEGEARINGVTVNVLEATLENFRSLAVTGNSYKEMPRLTDKEDALSFLEAVKRDTQAGLMIQDDNFHRGVFARETTDDYTGEPYWDTRESIYVSIEGYQTAWDVRIYPDCVNTMNWLIDRGLIIYTVYPDAILLPG